MKNFKKNSVEVQLGSQQLSFHAAMDKQRISRLGFNDQQKGQIVAALLKLSEPDRTIVFDDSDEVVSVTVQFSKMYFTYTPTLCTKLHYTALNSGTTPYFK